MKGKEFRSGDDRSIPRVVASRPSRPLSEVLADLADHLDLAPRTASEGLQRVLSEFQTSLVPEKHATAYNDLADELRRVKDERDTLVKESARNRAQSAFELRSARRDQQLLMEKCEDVEKSLHSAHGVMAEYFVESSSGRDFSDGSEQAEGLDWDQRF